jgi:hypothetical protein
MSGESAKKRRYDEISDFIAGEQTEKIEMEWEIRNFLTAIELSSDDDFPGDGEGLGIKMKFESGKSVS